MPELPDVENFKRYLDRTGRNKKIAHVQVRAGRILRGVSARRLSRALVHHKITRSRRHGKHLFARIDEGPWLALHFGMTGYFEYFKKPEGDHDRLRLDFTNERHLAFVNHRKFGKLHLIDAPDDFIAEEKLGPDALDRGLTAKRFRELLAGRHGGNQEGSGIGRIVRTGSGKLSAAAPKERSEMPALRRGSAHLEGRRPHRLLLPEVPEAVSRSCQLVGIASNAPRAERRQTRKDQTGWLAQFFKFGVESAAPSGSGATRFFEPDFPSPFPFAIGGGSGRLIGRAT